MRFSGAGQSGAGRQPRAVLRAPATCCWVLVLTGIHLWLSVAAGPDGMRWWYENLGLSREGTPAGMILRVFTYALLHGGWWHVALNVLFLWFVGSRIEHVAGARVMTRCVFLGIVAGGCGHLLLGSGLLVGVSGGCFALLLMHVTLSPDSRMMPLPVSGRSLGAGLLLAALLLALANPELGIPGIGAAGRALVDHGMGSWFEIGHACHLGGGLAGWLYGRWMLRPRVSLERLRRQRAKRELR